MADQNALIIENPASVLDALSALGMTRDSVVRIARAAVAARSEYLEGIDTVNYPGTRAYQDGIRQMRLQLKALPQGWVATKFHNIELVYSSDLGIMIGFQNVDRACGNVDPKAISERGEGTRQLVSLPYQHSLFGNNKAGPASRAVGTFPVIWLVCVAASVDRIQVEVSRPKPFTSDQFEGFFERIFVTDEPVDNKPLDELIAEDNSDEPEIFISKKQNGNS
ncbi:hypothetical protein IFR08_10850 [Pseudomonas fluorescens]|uniref:hypothetical protein n=1 Tax=Pseudomonas fluorescens TaxID=294 RepID=UPI00177E1BEB|nr:hypothetical protein [Pseudomonas fluorescens]MBD8099829.1 hypothetical protein [Pseudomonas fluorescens]MBD8774266.1 hypothetical protein [Pseudomonas fluorescens]MBD8781328.1 hypothetical protein [Pseudomonas fluorescens]MBD8796579.1 hypothetical protein [Pseudomonas fluorescens]